MEEIQVAEQQRPGNVNAFKEYRLVKEYDEPSRLEEIFLKHKSRNQWLNPFMYSNNKPKFWMIINNNDNNNNKPKFYCQ